MKNIVGIETLRQYVKMKRAGVFPSLEEQKFKSLGEFSHSWNDFVHWESARAAEQIGYGFSPLAFFNDILYT